MSGPGARGEGGYVTAETALVLPALIGLGFALVVVVAAAADQMRCTDAAWEAARGLARGGSIQDATAVAGRLAPAGATVSAGSVGGSVEVRVAARLSFSSALIPVVRITGRAELSCEPGVACPQSDPRDER